MTKLLTEQPTNRVERLARSAAAQQFGRGRASTIFEHGQWWVEVRGIERDGSDDRYFSVVDAHPGIRKTGLDFEGV